MVVLFIPCWGLFWRGENETKEQWLAQTCHQDCCYRNNVLATKPPTFWRERPPSTHEQRGRLARFSPRNPGMWCGEQRLAESKGEGPGALFKGKAWASPSLFVLTQRQKPPHPHPRLRSNQKSSWAAREECFFFPFPSNWDSFLTTPTVLRLGALARLAVSGRIVQEREEK